MMLTYIFCFFCSLIISLFCVPLSNFIAKKFNIYDKPSKRKLYFRKLTRWGGVGIFLSFFITLIITTKIFPQIKSLMSYKYTITWPEGSETISLSRQLLGIFFASVLIIIVGTIDDKTGIKPLPKFLLQVIVAYIAIDYGIRILGINFPFKNEFLLFPRIMSQIVTILWLCGFMNMVNLADGVDGLAAGIVIISSFTFFIISLIQRQTGIIAQQMTLASILSITLTGATSGFLVYNFYPAKLFMGDTGALFLGFIIGCITTVGVLKTGAMLSFVVPIIVAGVPFVDIIVSILRRTKKGVSIATADKEHLHHLLLSYGWTERETVLFFYIITFFLSFIAVALTVLKMK